MKKFNKRLEKIIQWTKIKNKKKRKRGYQLESRGERVGRGWREERAGGTM